MKLPCKLLLRPLVVPLPPSWCGGQARRAALPWQTPPIHQARLCLKAGQLNFLLLSFQSLLSRDFFWLLHEISPCSEGANEHKCACISVLCGVPFVCCRTLEVRPEWHMAWWQCAFISLVL